jgi:hypothetical protein
VKARFQSSDYDAPTVERVRRALEAVAEAGRAGEETVPPPGPDAVPRLGVGAVTPGSPRARIAWWAGAAGVAAVAAGLVAFVAGGPAERPGVTVDPAAGDPFTVGEGAIGVTDVAVPGAVPDGFDYHGFKVLDPLDGSIEVDVYQDDGALVAAFATDEPATALRLSERADLWGDVVVSDITEVRGDGYVAVTRDASAPQLIPSDSQAVIDALAAGADPAEAVPDGYEFVVSKQTDELPEAGRLVRVDYADGDRALRLETRQGRLDPELAALLYDEAQAVTVRGVPGFQAAGPGTDGSLLIWQEAPGLVVSVVANGVEPLAVDAFVRAITVVPESSWVGLREGAANREPSAVIETDARSFAEDDVAGAEFRLEAYEKGSLQDGVARCRRLTFVADDAEATACGDTGPRAIALGDVVVVWTAGPAGVVDVRTDVPLAGPAKVLTNPERRDGPVEVVVALTSDRVFTIELVDATGAVAATIIVPST